MRSKRSGEVTSPRKARGDPVVTQNRGRRRPAGATRWAPWPGEAGIVWSSENRLGRLIELRVVTPMSADEMLELQQTHLEVTRGVEGDYAVVVDMRRAQVFPPQISERFIALMSQLNPRLLRSAILINESAVLGLQAERAIEAAGNPDRKTFRDPVALERWLGEVLTERERLRLRSFLIEDSPLAS